MEKEFNYLVDQFADLQVLRYEVPGFEELSLKQKLLLYHLSEAALMGRDILYDQKRFTYIMTGIEVARISRHLRFI